MHLPVLLLLSASLASAQYADKFGPSLEELDFPKPINRHPHYVENGNIEIDKYGYDDYDDHDNDNTIPGLHTPSQTSSPSPTPRIHSTFLVRPSQTPSVHTPAHGYGYAYNNPGPDTDADTESRYNAPSFRDADYDDNVAPGASGDVAPIDPLAPGSQVAPPPLFVSENHGKDEGNAFCSGRCFEDEGDAQCAKPYVSFLFLFFRGIYCTMDIYKYILVMWVYNLLMFLLQSLAIYKPAKGCYMCCITSDF